VSATPFTDAELKYLSGQRLGRLATTTTDGRPQVSPVIFWYNADEATIDIGGHNLSGTRKYHNVEANGRAAFVVDDVLSENPFRVRGIEIRGKAEALAAQPGQTGFGSEIIRIRPRRVICWGIDATEPGVFGGPGRHHRTIGA
jgi:pyridoxamine 5'-phosphate oxidase family protein